ncbi:MAG: sulfatase-like hydrolase/transferase [Ilumatobacteraceae bacterium]
MTERPNVLLITFDQFRGDTFGARRGVIPTPAFDELGRRGVRFAAHHSQCAPCAPARASLYTGLYQCHHRVVANGTPLDDRFDNVARLARRAGYTPTLFGYTDQGLDPRLAEGPDDPRLRTYEGVLPGFEVELDLAHDMDPWRRFLSAHGADGSAPIAHLLTGEPSRHESLGLSAFTTDRLLSWIERRAAPWFAHASYLRPHPPYAAAGRWARAVTPDAVPDPVLPEATPSGFHRAALGHPAAAAPADEGALRRLAAQYYGMIGDVDEQLGRILAPLDASGAADRTVVIVTSDHGELLGDHGLLGKLGPWDATFHVPLFVADPRRPEGHGSTVQQFTEHVDVLGTIAELIGEPVPLQCDGRPLTGFLDGEIPPGWRSTTHWEFDWRDLVLDGDGSRWPHDRRIERFRLTVTRAVEAAYVQYGDGAWQGFDLTDPADWRRPLAADQDPFELARDQLRWRSEHDERTWTSTLLGPEPLGLPS